MTQHTDQMNGDPKYDFPCFKNTQQRKMVVTHGVKICMLIVLVFVTTLFGKTESAVDLRSPTERFNMVDIGFLLTQRLHNWLRANLWWHNALAALNTAFVGGCYVYGLLFQAYWRGRPGIVVCGLGVYALRLFCGWMTQLPVHQEYLASAYDWPDILLGENVNFFFFFSGHTAMPALLSAHVGYNWGYLNAAWMLHFGNILQCVRMLATRGHYSSDLVIGMLVGKTASKYVDWIDSTLPKLGIAKWVIEEPTAEEQARNGKVVVSSMGGVRTVPKTKKSA